MVVDEPSADNPKNETALIPASNQSSESCARCGVVVRVSLPVPDPVHCVECRQAVAALKQKQKQKQQEEKPPEKSSAASVSLAGDDILTVVCQLCHSSLLVDESKIGTKVSCPDCHSEILVQRSKPRTRRQTGRPKPERDSKKFDPNEPLSLEDPVKRPEIDPSYGLDRVTEDLLSAPLPERESDGGSEGEADDGGDASNAAAEVDPGTSKTPGTRRQRYERLQKRMISAGRRKMRRQAKVNRTKSNRATQDADDGVPPTKRKRRRKRSGRKAGNVDFVRPMFSWLREPVLVVGWLLTTGMLSTPYMAASNWGPISFVDRWYVKLTQTPPVWDIGLGVTSLLWVAGSFLTYYLCGRVFAGQATGGHDAELGDADRAGRSALFATAQFAFAWWVAGLPFLYATALLLPVQFLSAPPLLVASWLNGSCWKFVRANGLIATGDAGPSKRRWRRFYGQACAIAACAILPAIMIEAGGLATLVGCLLLVGIMVAFAGLCGWHCRELSKQLEPVS